VARMARSGVKPLPSEQGVALFDAARAFDRPFAVPLGIDPAALREQTAAGTVQPLLSALVRVSKRRTAAGLAEAASALEQRLAGRSAQEQQEVLLELVRTHVSTVLGHSSTASIPPTRPFKDLGFDSLVSVELRNRLQTVVGKRLPPTLVYDFPTPLAVAGQLLEVLAPAAGAGPAGSPVLDELDRIAGLLAAAPAEGDAAVAVADRLKALLRTWAERTAADGAAAPEQDLEQASDDELFAALDTELGVH